MDNCGVNFTMDFTPSISVTLQNFGPNTTTFSFPCLPGSDLVYGVNKLSIHNATLSTFYSHNSLPSGMVIQLVDTQVKTMWISRNQMGLELTTIRCMFGNIQLMGNFNKIVHTGTELNGALYDVSVLEMVMDESVRCSEGADQSIQFGDNDEFNHFKKVVFLGNCF